MTDRGLTHIALPVSNLDDSIAFYGKYANMQVVHRRSHAGASGSSVVWVSDKTRPFVIVLLRVDRVDCRLSASAHLGVACDSREEVDRLASMARTEGRLAMGPTDSGQPVGYWAIIADPDGHHLELSFGQEVAVTVDGSAPIPHG